MARSLSPRRSAHGSRPLSAELLLQFVCRATVGAKTAFITPGSPWKNGYCESFNARFRDELLNGEVFTRLREAQILIERWRRHYNTVSHNTRLRLAQQKASHISVRSACQRVDTISIISSRNDCGKIWSSLIRKSLPSLGLANQLRSKPLATNTFASIMQLP